VLNLRKATQLYYVDYGFQRWNRLAARIGPLGDACVQPNSGFSLMKGLALVIEPPGDANHFGSILVFSRFLDDSDRRKMAFVYVRFGGDQESS